MELFSASQSPFRFYNDVSHPILILTLDGVTSCQQLLNVQNKIKITSFSPNKFAGKSNAKFKMVESL